MPYANSFYDYGSRFDDRTGVNWGIQYWINGQWYYWWIWSKKYWTAFVMRILADKCNQWSVNFGNRVYSAVSVISRAIVSVSSITSHPLTLWVIGSSAGAWSWLNNRHVRYLYPLTGDRIEPSSPESLPLLMPRTLYLLHYSLVNHYQWASDSSA